MAAKRKVEASDPHTTNMGTCILYGKKKVEAAKIASTFRNSAFRPTNPSESRFSGSLEVEVLLYSRGTFFSGGGRPPGPFSTRVSRNGHIFSS